MHDLTPFVLIFNSPLVYQNQKANIFLEWWHHPSLNHSISLHGDPPSCFPKGVSRFTYVAQRETEQYVDNRGIPYYLRSTHVRKNTYRDFFMIRLLLIDEYRIGRQGLASLLQPISGMQVIGTIGDYCTGLVIADQQQPDIVIINHSSPGLNWLEFIKNIQAQAKPPRIIFLSAFFDDVWLHRAIESGISGYLMKYAGIAELETAIRRVAKGDRYIQNEEKKYSQDEMLTARECEVLTLIAEGHTSKEIGSILHISNRTVDHHRARLMNKLNLNDVPGLTRYAIRCGAIDPAIR